MAMSELPGFEDTQLFAAELTVIHLVTEIL
jgi:hypothetical protein